MPGIIGILRQLWCNGAEKTTIYAAKLAEFCQAGPYIVVSYRLFMGYRLFMPSGNFHQDAIIGFGVIFAESAL